MHFQQLIDRDLGCASYLLAHHGRGVVVDPGLDVARVVAAAEAADVRIELVLETHVHADHVSGRALLAERTGAAVHLPAGGGHDPAAGSPLRDGDAIDVGALRLTVLATPGHRPEHVAFLVADRDRSPEPWLLLGGDSLLVGDLARPDLAVDPHEGARALHATLARLRVLPGSVELWPGHVGGSLCGGPALSRKSSSTLGFELAVNPHAQAGPDELAARLIASLPPRPPTTEHVVARNRTQAPAPSGPVGLLAADATPAALAGATLLDARPAEAFDAAHIQGSLSLPLRGGGLGTRAAWVLAPGEELAVLAEDEPAARELARRLQAVGLGPVRSVVVGRPADVAAAAGLPLEAVAPIALDRLASLAGELTVVDVREASERRDRHLPDVVSLPLPRLRAEATALPDGPLALLCERGPRAALAASWLRAQGRDARRVAGGVADLLGAGLPPAARAA